MSDMEGPFSDIDSCAVHIIGSDPDCEFCDAQLERMNERYVKQMQKNEALERALQREGAGIDPQRFFALRLDMITSIIFNDPKVRLNFEMQFGLQIEKVFIDATQEVRRAKIVAPNGMPVNQR